MTAEDHPDLCASDSERDRTIDMLRDASAEGRPTFEELADRIEDAAAARRRGELELLTRDLPAASSAAAATAGELAAPALLHRRAISHLRTRPYTQSPVFGDVRRSGPGVVPVRSSWRSCFGDIVLDLREARVGAGEVTIEARSCFGDIVLDLREARVGAGEVTIEAHSIFGDIDLLVPEGIAVEDRTRSILGYDVHTAGAAAAPDGRRVILTGRPVFGDVHVRARRLRERIADRLLGRAPRG
jgi:Domain of unknown function (DUF1707)/Cell wall-active antibiotics response 4TMS YvqF